MGCSSKERLKAAERFHLITEERKAQNTSQEPILQNRSIRVIQSHLCPARIPR